MTPAEIASRDAILVRLDEVEAYLKSLRGFAKEIMAGWPDGDRLDVFDLQEIAASHGLLTSHCVYEPCGENCACIEYGEFPVECFRKTDLLKSLE